MITALIIGGILGFVLALPPGPVAMANIRLSLEKGRKEGFEYAIGTAGMDMLYCMFSIFAASAIEGTVGSYFRENPIFLLIFQAIVIISLLYVGFTQLRKKKSLNDENVQQIDNSKFNIYIQTLKTKGPFLLGIALSLTNIANPTFLPSLAIMSAWVQKFHLFTNLYSNNLIFSLGFGLGNFLWLYSLSVIVIRNKHRLSDSMIFRIRQFAGLTLIGFGGLIGYRMLVFTNWTQVLKLFFAI